MPQTFHSSGRLASLLLIVLTALVATSCGGTTADDQPLPPPFFLAAQIDVQDDGQPPIRSTLNWWFAEPGRWRYDLHAGGHDGEPPRTITVFGDGNHVVVQAGPNAARSDTERIDLGEPARPLLISSLLLGPVDARTRTEFLGFLRDLAGDANVTVIGEETVLGRITTIVEVRPAFRGVGITATLGTTTSLDNDTTTVETEGGSVRYWLDESTMLVLRVQLDGPVTHALAEVTELDLAPALPQDPFFDPDA